MTSLKQWQKHLLRGLALMIVCVAALGADNSPAARYMRDGHGMICVCSCAQVLVECNHVGCPDSGRMLEELKQQIAANSSDQVVFNWFATKYGPTVLGSPIRGGFDNAAWIVPGVVFLLATVGVGFLVNAWRRKQPIVVAAPQRMTRQESELRERIRKETKYE